MVGRFYNGTARNAEIQTVTGEAATEPVNDETVGKIIYGGTGTPLRNVDETVTQTVIAEAVTELVKDETVATTPLAVKKTVPQYSCKSRSYLHDLVSSLIEIIVAVQVLIIIIM